MPLISKKTLNRAHVIRNIPLKKSELQNGDLCMIRDGSVGMYIEKTNKEQSKAFGTLQQRAVIVFFLAAYADISYYPTEFYTEDLKDKDDDTKYDVMKLIRVSLDFDIEDPIAIKAFLKNRYNYINYFK